MGLCIRAMSVLASMYRYIRHWFGFQGIPSITLPVWLPTTSFTMGFTGFSGMTVGTRAPGITGRGYTSLLIWCLCLSCGFLFVITVILRPISVAGIRTRHRVGANTGGLSGSSIGTDGISGIGQQLRRLHHCHITSGSTPARNILGWNSNPYCVPRDTVISLKILQDVSFIRSANGNR